MLLTDWLYIAAVIGAFLSGTTVFVMIVFVASFFHPIKALSRLLHSMYEKLLTIILGDYDEMPGGGIK